MRLSLSHISTGRVFKQNIGKLFLQRFCIVCKVGPGERCLCWNLGGLGPATSGQDAKVLPLANDHVPSPSLDHLPFSLVTSVYDFLSPGHILSFLGSKFRSSRETNDLGRVSKSKQVDGWVAQSYCLLQICSRAPLVFHSAHCQWPLVTLTCVSSFL